MATATLVKKLDGWRGDAALYKLSEPTEESDYVVVSAVDLNFGMDVLSGYRTSETMVFAADADGETSMLDIAMVPYKSHEDALKQLGYEVAR